MDTEKLTPELTAAAAAGEPAAGETILQVDGLGLSRGSFSLQDVSFSLRRGESLSLLGPTGAGKSMLLETVAGFYRPQAGSVRYQGREVSRIPLHRRNIGYLFQDYALFQNMTVRRNIGYGLKMQGRPAAEIGAAVERMADWFGISHLLEQYPGTLSGGEQQRTALARALLTRPALLLLDEPFSALDPQTSRRLYGKLREIRREFSCAMIFVTHDFHEAQELSDRVGILIRGRLCGVVPQEELYTAAWPPDAAALLGIEENNQGGSHD
ncbi:MAG: ATP-binding cassette domain-containing protein [Firmicutes bacterium]|nr:ATP-binding cassette domain-containing protein [Bacillota bacterium]